jgi:hypothetical protein
LRAGGLDVRVSKIVNGNDDDVRPHHLGSELIASDAEKRGDIFQQLPCYCDHRTVSGLVGY